MEQKKEDKAQEQKKPDARKSAESEDFKKRLEEKNKQIDELTDTLKRLQAEFENYRKRVDKEKTEFAKYAHAGIIAKILPALDSFEMALKHTNEPQKFISGMKLIYAQLHSALEADGLRTIKTDGEKFDPYRHEVLMQAESDKDDTILEEFQKGYMLGDSVLRHSKVKIGKKKPENLAGEEKNET